MSSSGSGSARVDYTQQRVGSRVIHIYTYRLYTPVAIGTDDSTEIDSLMDAIDAARREIINQGGIPPTAVFAIRYIGTGGQYFQTRFMSQDEAFRNARGAYENLANQYRESDDTARNVVEFQIMWVDKDANAIAARAGTFGARMVEGNCIISPGSDINCGFTALALAIKFMHKITPKQSKHLFDKHALNKLGAKFKLRYPEYSGADCCTNPMFQDLAERNNVNLRIYDTDLTHLIMDYKGKHADTVELCYYGGHIAAIIKKSAIDSCGSIVFEQRVDKGISSVLSEEFEEDEEEYIHHEMLLSEALEQQYGAYTFTVEMMDEFMNEDSQCIQIPKKHTDKEFNRKFAAWDSETTNKTALGVDMDQKPYSVGWAYYDYNQLQHDSTDPRTPWLIEYTHKLGFDCLSEMMEEIHKHRNLSGYTFYAHNSSKFDLHVFFQHKMLELKDWKITQLSTRGGAILKVTFESRTIKGFKLYFLDSVRLIPGPLAALLKETGTQHQKLDFDHTTVNEENCLNNPLLESYQRNDVVGLLELLHIYASSVWDSMKINVTACLTAASMAKRNFFQNHYIPWKQPIYKLPSFMDKYIRSGYNGGRVEACKIGHMRGKFFYYDVTSLYPSEACRKLPFGLPIVYLENSEVDYTRHVFRLDPQNSRLRLRDTVFGFLRVMVKGPNPGVRPLHSIYSNDKLLFPVLETWTEMVLFSEEIRLACDMDLGYDYRVKDYVLFGASTILKDTMETGFKKKAEEAAKGNHTSANAQKIVINSTYGFFGLVVDEMDSIKMYYENDPVKIDDRISAMLVEDRFKAYLNIGEYHLLRGNFDIRVKDFNVAIAAAITSYSRMTLYKIMDCFEKDGGNIYYYDTDSVIVDKSIKDCPTVKKYYQTDGTGEALGMLKNECAAVIKKKFKDSYDKEILLEPEPYFDEMVLLGCKNYAVIRHPRYHGGPIIKILKMKGIDQRKPITSVIDTHGEEFEVNRSISFEDYKRLAEGYVLKQKQEQFKAGYGTMMSQETKGGSRIVTVEKKLCLLYNKGKLEETTPGVYKVVPLCISESEDRPNGRIRHKNARYEQVCLKNFIVAKYKAVKKVDGTKRKKSTSNTSKKIKQ